MDDPVHCFGSWSSPPPNQHVHLASTWRNSHDECSQAFPTFRQSWLSCITVNTKGKNGGGLGMRLRLQYIPDSPSMKGFHLNTSGYLFFTWNCWTQSSSDLKLNTFSGATCFTSSVFPTLYINQSPWMRKFTSFFTTHLQFQNACRGLVNSLVL